MQKIKRFLWFLWKSNRSSRLVWEKIGMIFFLNDQHIGKERSIEKGSRDYYESQMAHLFTLRPPSFLRKELRNCFETLYNLIISAMGLWSIKARRCMVYTNNNYANSTSYMVYTYNSSEKHSYFTLCYFNFNELLFFICWSIVHSTFFAALSLSKSRNWRGVTKWSIGKNHTN